MELNSNGLVVSASVSESKRIRLKRKDNETVKQRLSVARTRGRVQLGEVAVFDDRQWLRVKASDFNGAAWIELD